MSDSLEFGQSIRSTIMDDKDNEGSSDKKSFSKKALIIMVVCIVCAIALTVGLVLYFILQDNDDESTPEPKPEPGPEPIIEIPQ